MAKILRKYARCSGCSALDKSEDGTKYECKLNVLINYKTNNSGKAFSPVPSTTCYKPKTSGDLEELQT
jgi:hypothetical protein